MSSITGTPRVPSAVDPQDPKATTGTTYDNFSLALEELMRTTPENKLLMDLVSSAVRLREWRPFSEGKMFQLPTKQGFMTISVTAKFVEIDDGRPHRIAEGYAADALHRAIKHAQELVHPLLDPLPDAPDEEFFEPPTIEERGEAIDLMLKDRGHTLNGNKLASQEADDIKDEYSEKAEPKFDPRMDEASIQRHLKSLQGRILTIVDASLNAKQCKAVKTLVNKEFRREMEKVGKHFLDDPRCEQSDGE